MRTEHQRHLDVRSARRAGYKVYLGSQSGTYNTSNDVGLATRQIVSSLEFGRTYYFAVTAYDRDGQESGFSTEVTYTAPIDGTNACAVPLGLTFSGATPTISFTGEPGRKYYVQASGDLLAWQTIHVVPVSSAETCRWSDPDAASFSKRFYRVIAATE